MQNAANTENLTQDQIEFLAILTAFGEFLTQQGVENLYENEAYQQMVILSEKADLSVSRYSHYPQFYFEKLQPGENVIAEQISNAEKVLSVVASEAKRSADAWRKFVTRKKVDTNGETTVEKTDRLIGAFLQNYFAKKHEAATGPGVFYIRNTTEPHEVKWHLAFNRRQ
jgi:hypothetical protein